MASSVLSYFLQSREHAWMWEKSSARVCVCVSVCEDEDVGKNYSGDDI